MSAEIAVRQLKGLATILASEGVALSDLAGATAPDLVDLDDIYARIDWQDYATILDNIERRWGAAKLRAIGAATLHLHDAYIFRANIHLGFDDPALALASMCAPTGAFRSIVPCIDVEFESTGKRSCIVRTRMQQGYAPCRAHHELSAGTMTEFPRVMSEKPAHVDLTVHDNGVDYHVRFARSSLSGALRRRWQRSKPNQAFLSALGEVFIELSTRQATLQQESQLRVETEEKLRHTEKMDALGQLTGGVAHDFNNLLFVIQGNLDLLRPRLTEEADQHLFEAADSAVKHGAALTKQLLAFGRQAPLNPTTLDLNSIVQQMQALLSRTLGEQVDIEAVLSAGLWKTSIDRALLETAIINLALNARDAMPNGGRLTIETANVRLDHDHASQQGNEIQPGKYVMLSLTDTGEGMSAQTLARAFDPFFTTKAVGAGSGLGLAMVYGFLKQSNGVVRIYTEPGIGTSVKIYLPEAPDKFTSATPPQVETETRGAGEVILVVEDDPAVQKTVVLQLKELGYEPVTADDGDSAMDVLQSVEDIRVMLTDVVLRGSLMGPALARQVVSQQPAIGIVYMSGYPDGAAVGASGIPQDGIRLAKPFHRLDLARAMQHALS